MYGVADDPVDHMKCYLFKTCDTLEDCPECTTGNEKSRGQKCFSKPRGKSKVFLNHVDINVFLKPRGHKKLITKRFKRDVEISRNVAEISGKSDLYAVTKLMKRCLKRRFIEKDLQKF